MIQERLGYRRTYLRRQMLARVIVQHDRYEICLARQLAESGFTLENYGNYYFDRSGYIFYLSLLVRWIQRPGD